MSEQVPELRGVQLKKRSFQRRKERTYLTKSIVHILRWLVDIGKVNGTMLSEKRSMKFFKSYPILQTKEITVRLTDCHFHVGGI